MNNYIIAKRYAKALCGAAGSAELDKVGEELGNIKCWFDESKEVKAIFCSPVVNHTIKKRIVDEILKREKPSTVVENFLRLLLDKNRIGYFNEIFVLYGELSDQLLERVRVKVKIAVNLNASQQTKLKSKLKKATGKEVLLETEQDSEMLGGVIVNIGDTIFDGSVRNQLNNIKDSLTSA